MDAVPVDVNKNVLIKDSKYKFKSDKVKRDFNKLWINYRDDEEHVYVHYYKSCNRYELSMGVNVDVGYSRFLYGNDSKLCIMENKGFGEIGIECVGNGVGTKKIIKEVRGVDIFEVFQDHCPWDEFKVFIKQFEEERDKE
jgi:hypothetical protein